ncbi:MAG: hypothetical protein ABWX57_00090 [Aeromicrobium sp.]
MRVISKPLSATIAVCLGALTVTGVQPASADDGGGTITGHVTIAGGDYATSVDVDLWTSAGTPVSHAVTDGNGVYVFDKVPAGSYVLEFENQTESMYEWYDNSPDLERAKRVPVTDGGTSTADIHMPIHGENLTLPTITGTATVGSTLSGTSGTWYPAPGSIAHQWLRDGSPVAGATGTTYTVTSADAGARLSFRATAQINSRHTPATSAATATVPGGTPVTAVRNTAAPTVSGTGQVGAALQATTGTWTPTGTSVALQWLRNGTPVSGATSATYTVVAADAGAAISVRATGTHPGSTPSTATSSSISIAPVVVDPDPDPEPEPALTLLGAPSVTGTARVGSVLTGSSGAWSRPASFSFQWLRSGAAIPGATAGSYRLTAADAGLAVSLRVTAAAGSTVTVAGSAGRTVAKATTRARTTLKASKRKKLKVTTRLTSHGARSGVVRVSVRIGSRTVVKRVRLVRGTATVTVKGLRKGRATVTVTYGGDRSTSSASTRGKVSVR